MLYLNTWPSGPPIKIGEPEWPDEDIISVYVKSVTHKADGTCDIQLAFKAPDDVQINRESVFNRKRAEGVS